MGIYEGDLTRADLLSAYSNPSELESVFPAEATLESATWTSIKHHYVSTAPEQLPSVAPSARSLRQDLFKPRFPEDFLSPPGTIMTRFGPSGTYYIGDANRQSTFLVDGSHRITAQISVPGGAVDLYLAEDTLYLGAIGDFSPTDDPTGTVSRFVPREPVRTVIAGLRRPVQLLAYDLDGDGLQDFVIPEYGQWRGRLRWWQRTTSGEYHPRTLLDQPGALRVAVTDLNQDGRPDLIGLFAQGDESFWAFYNEGAGNFRAERIMRLPPTYGSSYFELIDWNGDDRLDILYTNGDNADYPPIVKPYHGIRVFTQTSEAKFEEELFLPLPGAYRAAAQDFDSDGDLDVLAIAFFPDFHQRPDRSIVYYENRGTEGFAERSFAWADSGRWITMDVADHDRDGDADVLIGALAFEIVPPHPLLRQWIDNGLGWVYLENITKR